MRWESRAEDAMATDFGHMGFPYVATWTLLLGTAYVALALGGYLLTARLENLLGTHHWYIATGLLALYAILTEGSYLSFFLHQWRRSRTPPSAARHEVTGQAP
jgi:hypothetical protein